MQKMKMLHDLDNFFHLFLFTGESASKTNAAMKAVWVAFSRIVALCVVGGRVLGQALFIQYKGTTFSVIIQVF